MDVIKVEHESNIDTQPMPSASEDQAAAVKLEDPLEPFTFVAVKQEVVSTWWFNVDTIIKNGNMRVLCHHVQETSQNFYQGTT